MVATRTEYIYRIIDISHITYPQASDATLNVHCSYNVPNDTSILCIIL